MRVTLNIIYTVFLFIAYTSCKQAPKVINATNTVQNKGYPKETGIFSESKTTINSEIPNNPISNMHKITVLEVLPTDKYVYLKVTENNEEFWIATGKKEVHKGEIYYYKNGLLKTNFESKEYNRVFDKIYLVSNIVSDDHSRKEKIKTTVNKPQVKLEDIEREGSEKIANIVNNPKKFNGKIVQISGVCTKLNPNIMGRNWIHLSDGSMDDFDMVVTSDISIPVGHIVTMQGTVVLDKDFGAGYRYAIIIENGQLINSNL